MDENHPHPGSPGCNGGRTHHPANIALTDRPGANAGRLAGAPAPDKPTSIVVLDQIAERVNTLLACAQELDAITNRLVGPTPAAVGENSSNAARANPNHVNGKISVINDELAGLYELLAHSLKRLTHFV